MLSREQLAMKQLAREGGDERLDVDEVLEEGVGEAVSVGVSVGQSREGGRGRGRSRSSRNLAVLRQFRRSMRRRQAEGELGECCKRGMTRSKVHTCILNPDAAIMSIILPLRLALLLFLPCHLQLKTNESTS